MRIVTYYIGLSSHGLIFLLSELNLILKKIMMQGCNLFPGAEGNCTSWFGKLHKPCAVSGGQEAGGYVDRNMQEKRCFEQKNRIFPRPLSAQRPLYYSINTTI